MSSLRGDLFAYAASRVDEILAGIDDSGKVWLDGAWGIMNQDTLLPLTALAMLPHPRNPCYGRAELIEAAHRIAQGTFALQDHLGRVEFVKPDGSRWGWVHMPWTFYGMLEAYQLLAVDVPELRRQYWKGRLQLVYSHVRDELMASPSVHNIPTWHGMALVLAGRCLGRPDYHRLGEQVVRRAAGAQTEAGYWVEGTGPTTLYNLVYTHALGVYHRLTGDPGVLPALKRAGRFHRLSQYPDGSLVSVIDGRVRYHARRPLFGLPGLACTDDGRAYLGTWQRGALPIACEANGWTALGSCLVHLDDEPVAPNPAEGDIEPNRVRIVRHGPWTIVGSALCGQAERSNRWWSDRAQHFEIHHADRGLVVGGGNSKADPALSLARFKLGDAEGDHYAVDAELLADSTAVLALRTEYPTGQVTWRVLADGDGLVIEASAAGSGDCTVSFQLWANPGDLLLLSGHRILDDTPVAVPTQSFELRGVRFSGPSVAVLAWPVLPFNPYAADGAADLEEAVATWSFPLPPGSVERVRIETVR